MIFEKKNLKENMEIFVRLGQIGGLKGVNRLFGSEQYHKAAEAMCEYFNSIQMESYIDTVGNVHGIFHSENSDGREILIGSHLDTVKEGGIFDGLLGIVAGAECVRRLKQENVFLNYDIHVIATNGEEGNELGGTFGSSCLVGEMNTESVVFQEKAADYGLNAEKVSKAKMDFSKTRCYLELHIEQGEILEKQKQKIGVVTGIVGLQRYHIHIQGMSNHAGTTKMEYRRDALVAASQIILYGDELARSYPNSFVATFETFKVSPCVLAVINGEVDMVLECRSQDKMLMEQYMSEMQEVCRSMKEFHITMSPIVKKSPVKMQDDLIKTIEEVCKKQDIANCRMQSGATHDGNMYAHQVPVGMIFVPSRDGISHCSQEWTDWEDCIIGLEVLYQTLKTIK